ncbi:PAS domain S-box protein [Scytonema sp. PCC 10023]|uniref:PAS domain S-box protein n=1 Tax=Scytonema sp. PCC 10023 TaxID=1680591 RepID=UPI0039C6361F
MSVRQLAQFIESFRDRLNTLQQQISELPKTQMQSEQISQTFAALQTSLEILIRDYTTQEPSEERFSTGEYELQALFNEALDAMLIADDAGSYVDVNLAACELLGLSREEILTKSVGDFLEPGVDFSQGWQQFLEQGRVRGESRVLRPDGTVRETENTAVANFVPHRHLSILRDITERKRIEAERNQIEAELQQKQRFIEQIAQSMPAILYVYDLCEQRNVYANRQLMEVLGLSAETVQAMGTGVLQILIHPDDWMKVAESLKQYATVRDGEVIEIEYRMRHANGEWIWLYSREVVLTRNADGSSRQILGTATDITRLKQIEQELRQSQAKYRALSEELEQRVTERTTELTRETSKREAAIRDRQAALRDRQAALRDYQAMLRNYQAMLCDHQAMLRDHQRLQHELRTSQQKYKTLFDILPIGIAITDPEGKVIEVNPASEEIFGISAAEHCRRRYDSPEWQVIRPDGSPKPSSEYAGVIALTEQRVVRDVEMGVFKPNGEIAWICLTSAPIPLESYGVASVYVDITQRKQAEIALRQSEEQLRLITDSLPVCISYVDREQRYRFVNKTYEAWFGCNRDEIYGRTAREFVGEAAYSAIEKHIERVLAGETVYYESQMPYRLGSKRYISGTLVPNFDAQSQVKGFYGLVTDITERKQAEMQLVETRNFLQSVLDHLPVAVFTKEVSNLRFVLWNPACTELMGYTAEDVLGKTAYEVFTTQHADFCTAKDQEVLATSEAVEILEGMICTKQGETKIVRAKKVGIYDEQGNPQFLLGFAEDITERKRAEIALRESQERLANIIANIPGGVYRNIYHADGRFSIPYLSPGYRTLMGIDPDEMMNHPEGVWTMIHPDDRDKFSAAIEVAKQTGEPEYLVEFRLVSPECKVTWIQDNARFFWSENGDFIVDGVDIIINDRKLAEDRLRASLQEKEVLLAEIHHRVKNNLYVICSLLELQMDRLSDPQAKTALEDSCNRVNSMALVHENLYRANDFSGVDFAEYVQQLAGDLLANYESLASNVMLNFGGDPVFLSLDQAIPCGLLLNELMSNALKHGFPEGSSGHIYILLTCLADGWIELKLGNDGDRLPPDFDLEQNASMGLRLVIMFVEQLTGSLELERGEVTWFKVRFPQR